MKGGKMQSYCIQKIENNNTKPYIILEPQLNVDTLVSMYKELKEKYGLTKMQLAIAIGSAESTVSRIFSKHHNANKSTLFALYLALKEYEEMYEIKEMQANV